MIRYLKNGWLAAAVLAALILILAGFTLGGGSLGEVQLTGAGGRNNPALTPGMNFVLMLDGQTVGYFVQVGGLGSKSELIEHRVVNDRGIEITRVIPGRLQWTPVTLQRGMTQDQQLSTWRNQVTSGQLEGVRKNATITALDANYQEVAVWQLSGAWPAELVYTSMDDPAGMVIEQLVLAYENLYREK